MRPRWMALAVLLALLLGLAAGYCYRRWKNPTLEERVHDTADELRRAFDKATR